MARLTQVLVWLAASIIYNLFVHPLRSFPGPLLQRASGIPWAIQHASGTQAFNTQRLHDRYGPVVRIGPGHLSFTDSRAWKDIYGHRVHESNMGDMSKSETFTHVIREMPSSIINADREEHQRFRRALSHGFSDSSMRQQEPLIVKYVDLLLKRLTEECDNGKTALNIEAWYNWTTFDVIGNLVFGQSFGCLESREYHPWIAFILKGTRFVAVIKALSYVGLSELVQIMFKYGAASTLKTVRSYTEAMVTSRLTMDKEREDLFEGLVKRRDEWVCETCSVMVDPMKFEIDARRAVEFVIREAL